MNISLIPLFFLTALLYSTAGFAGGSTYLAILTLFSLPFTTLRQVALLCNLVVASGGFYLFFKEGHFPKKVLPFVLTSVPAAFFGGRFPIGERLFTWLLGLSLFVAAFRMLLSTETLKIKREVSWPKSCLIGKRTWSKPAGSGC